MSKTAVKDFPKSIEGINEGQVILVDKPLTWTSFQVVGKLKWTIRKLTGEKKFKIGHAGTLDPLATGLLIVCTGKFTKTIDQIQAMPKTYIGLFHIGATTPCCDLEQAIDKYFPTEHITEDLIYATAKSFIGEQLQVPPVFSANKINGERAYEKARRGEQVEMKSKLIHIYGFEITRIALPEVEFKIQCSKGTYIRSIARDFGIKLESGAHLKALRRTAIGNYEVESAVNPVEFSEELLNRYIDKG
jgi:tRNA pseudouridine55 synthase